jgi:ribosomal protein S18 acetylase RimI-like enzyme
MRIGTDTVTHIRKLQLTDKESIHAILKATNVFSDKEVEVAMELVDEFLNDPTQKDYDLYVSVDEHDAALGYICFGPVALTNGTFDLYWIAVKPSCHHRGIGKELLLYTEEVIWSRDGQLIVLETSSQPKYENTRRFYIRNGYKEVARISNYYNMDDDLVIYGKYMSHN